MSVALLEIVVRARRDLVEDQLLGGAAAEQRRHLVLQLALGHQEPILGRQLHRVAERRDAARDDRDLVDVVVAGQRRRHQRVSELVVGDALLLARATAPGSSSRARRRRVRPPPAAPRGRPCPCSARTPSSAASLMMLARSAPTNPAVIGAMTSRSAVDSIDTLRACSLRISRRAGLSGRSTSTWRSKRPARSSAGSRISGRLVAATRMTPTRGVEAVQLDEQLVQRLLALFMRDRAHAARLAERVQLVDEDDARRLLLGLLEQVAHARRAHADEHLDEVGAADGEERDARLAGDRARQQRLAGSRRSDEQDALGELGAQPAEARRRLQEVDHLAQLLLRLVDAGDVGEPDVDVLLHVDLGLAAAQRHEAVLPRLAEAANHQHPEHADERDRDQPADGVAPERALDDAGDAHAVRVEVLQQIRVVDADGLEGRAALAVASAVGVRSPAVAAVAEVATASADGGCCCDGVGLRRLRRRPFFHATLDQRLADRRLLDLVLRDRDLEVAVRDARRTQVGAQQLLHQQDGPQTQDEVAERELDLLLFAVHHSQTKTQFRHRRCSSCCYRRAGVGVTTA